MKKVLCLYRVSTLGQVDPKDDIPMQRRECEAFIEQQKDWVFYGERLEKGVSGYKVSANKRDVILEIRAMAERKEFDVLLVFKFDRLGRREDETPFLVQWFILIILVSIILLSVVRNRERRINAPDQEAKWMSRGLGTLIFPVLFAVIDALETIVSGICLDTTYGYGMPEGDSIIIIGMEYAVFALGCWIYIWCKEKKVYNPFTRHNAPRILGAVADNAAIVFYSYAMAMNSVSTDPILAVYPILVMIGGRVFMKEKVSTPQYIFLIGIVVGSIMVIAGTL